MTEAQRACAYMHTAAALRRRFPEVDPDVIVQAVDAVEDKLWGRWNAVTSCGADPAPLLIGQLRTRGLPYPLAMRMGIWAQLTPATRDSVTAHETAVFIGEPCSCSASARTFNAASAAARGALGKAGPLS